MRDRIALLVWVRSRPALGGSSVDQCPPEKGAIIWKRKRLEITSGANLVRPESDDEGKGSAGQGGDTPLGLIVNSS